MQFSTALKTPHPVRLSVKLLLIELKNFLLLASFFLFNLKISKFFCICKKIEKEANFKTVFVKIKKNTVIRSNVKNDTKNSKL